MDASENPANENLSSPTVPKTSDLPLSAENNQPLGEDNDKEKGMASLAEPPNSSDGDNQPLYENKDKENDMAAVATHPESSVEESCEQEQSEKEKSENAKTFNSAQESLSAINTEEETNEESVQNLETEAPQNNSVEVDGSGPSSMTAKKNTDKQLSIEGSKENETESFMMNHASGSVPSSSHDEHTVNGSNKENENNASTVCGTATTFSATLPKDRVISTSINTDAGENESQNNSGDEAALVIDDRRDPQRPLDVGNALPLTHQPAKALPEVAPNVAVQAPIKSTKGRKPGTPRQAPKFDKEDLEHLRLPEKHGWMRELVYRGTFEGESRKMDIYYHPPSGRKLRSMMDIGAYLDKQENYPLNRTHFTFRKEKLFEPPFELVRSAGQPVRAFSSPNVSSKKKGSPSTSTTPAGRMTVKLPDPKISRSTPGPKKTFPGRSIYTSVSNATPISSTVQKRGGHQAASVNFRTNGTGSNLTQLARGALRQSIALSNKARASATSMSSQATPQSQTNTGSGFGLNNSRPSNNGPSTERPAATWKMIVTPKTVNRKIRPRPKSPDWRPSGDSSNNSDDSEAEENMEIIKQGARDTEEDEIQRVMGTASDLIASIVQQSKSQPPKTLQNTTVNYGPGNNRSFSMLSPSSIQPQRCISRTVWIYSLIFVDSLKVKSDPRRIILRAPGQIIRPSTSLMSLMPRLHPSTLPSNPPIHILPAGYRPNNMSSSISNLGAGLSSTFPPPPPLASCPTIRPSVPPPLNLPSFVKILPSPQPGPPRAPPALKPCPLLMDTNAPGQIVRNAQPVPSPPPLAHRSFTPNTLQQHGSYNSPPLFGPIVAPESVEKNRTPSVEEKRNVVVLSDEGEDVLCIDQGPQADGNESTAAANDQQQRKRQAPPDSNSSDEEISDQDTHQSKRARVERRKSPEPSQANADSLKAVKNMVMKRKGLESKGDGQSSELAPDSAVLRGILNKPPDIKNTLPEVNQAESDEDDEFLPTVTFAPEATPSESSQSLSISSENDEALDLTVSSSAFTLSTETITPSASAILSKSSDKSLPTVSVSNMQMPEKNITSSPQLLTLPSALKEKLDLNLPLLLALNGQEIIIPPARVLATQGSLKVLLPPGTNMSLRESAKTLSVAVSNVPALSSDSSPYPKFPRASHLRSSFRPLQECVGIMTRLSRFFSIPHLLSMFFGMQVSPQASVLYSHRERLAHRGLIPLVTSRQLGRVPTGVARHCLLAF
ncbi:methyl-CpG-binding domain protein 3 [Elysia marginata]|uniref:Methyl-CpG-binding domain protein 3 n=1 Tax=Elysia marginata TaxID=1093978 RepID=A0AAV4FNM5_9GAST|nr:methyl-CpG-binding domain protein 3 [Elysia marginata]